MMSAGMDQIKKYFSNFRHRVDAYKEQIGNPELRQDYCEAAYEGLYKLSQRIKKEMKHVGHGGLDKSELAFCHNFLNDHYLNGLLQLRTVATHVVSDTGKKEGHITFYTPNNNEITLNFETSAAAAFSIDTLELPNQRSGVTSLSHLEELNAAIVRINKLLKDFA